MERIGPMSHTSEKLNLWDRWFNRYRREVIGRGSSTWHNTWEGHPIPGSECVRPYVEYRIIDRLTGSERIEREYLN
jgi:hypothetical protein